MAKRGWLRSIAVGLALVLTGCAAAPKPVPERAAGHLVETPQPWVKLLDGTSFGAWQSTRFGGEGEVHLKDGALVLPVGSMLTGVHWTGARLPSAYEIEVVAARTGGTDFFCGLTLPVGKEHATVVLGGWGGGLCGLSSVDGLDASENATRQIRGFATGRDYVLRVRVDEGAVAAWVDGEPLFHQERAGHAFGLRVEVLRSRPLGIASFATTAHIRGVRLRSLAGAWDPQATGDGA